MSRALREAFVAGARAYLVRAEGEAAVGPRFNDYWMPEALEVYPPKMVEQPREVVVTFKGMSLAAIYRFVDGEFQMQTSGSWVPSSSASFSDGEFTVESGCFEPHSVIALMGLIDEPTETVELDD